MFCPPRRWKGQCSRRKPKCTPKPVFRTTPATPMCSLLRRDPISIAASVAGDYLRRFYFLVSKLISPRIGSIIETREARIAGDLAEAQRMKDEADAAVAKILSRKSPPLAPKRRASQPRPATPPRRSRTPSAISSKPIWPRRFRKPRPASPPFKAAARGEVSTVAQDAASEIVTGLTGVSVNLAKPLMRSTP